MKTRSFRASLVACCVTALAVAPAADAAKPKGSPGDPAAKKFVREVSVNRITKHQAALQQIADANGGTRDVLTPGYQASVQYVTQTLTKAGYKVKLDRFDFPAWKETAPPVLKQVSPTAQTYRPGTADEDGSPAVDFITMAYSPTVSLTNAKVVPTNDVQIPSTGGSTSGCEASDYPAAVAGNVALVQRGTCTFVLKWLLAKQAGATAIIIFNEGNTPDRQNPLYIEDKPDDSSIPAVIASYTVGQDLYNAYKAGDNPTVDLSTFGLLQSRIFPQVIAETKGGDPNHVVVVGAHLDSVAAGPGINDDGSGTASQLVMAQRLAKPGHPLKQKIRFAWWGAEEEGLIGSRYYASHLSQPEVDKIDVMLDYDMLSSPNYVRFIYDGDGSEPGDEDAKGPEGSGKVEQVFEDWFASKGLLSDRGPFDGRSDYVGFTERNIPSGGIFAGAEGVKTEDQERIYGGDAGSWYDPCYHQACDNLSTVLTGVPPSALDTGAQGLESEDETPTLEERQAAAEKMRGGAQKSLAELAGAASYAVWYFSSVKDPFGAGQQLALKKAPKSEIRAKRDPAIGR